MIATQFFPYAKKDVYLQQALQINTAISGVIKMENSLF